MFWSRINSPFLQCNRICHENFCPLEKICPRTNFRVNSPAKNCLRMRISVLQCSFGLFKACFCPTMEFHTSYDIIACCSVYSVSILLSSMHKDEDLIEQAYLYLTKKKYPEECTASRKRQIRKKAEKFTIVGGELYYLL